MAAALMVVNTCCDNVCVVAVAVESRLVDGPLGSLVADSEVTVVVGSPAIL